MPRGGKREGAGRPKGSIDKNGTQKKMIANNFNQFEKDLIVSYLNHRHGDAPIKELPLFTITYDHHLNMSLVQLDRNFGPDAKPRLQKWFDIEQGRPGHLSVLELCPGMTQVKLYLWLEENGLLKKIRRDRIDGLFDSWPVMMEFVMKRRMATLEAEKHKSNPPGDFFDREFGEILSRT